VAGVTIFGITGRMGQTLMRALREGAGAPGSGIAAGGGQTLRLCGAVAAPHSSGLGVEAAVDGGATGVLVTADPRTGLTGASVAIDFSVPQCVAANARACAAAKVPLLVGTTGFDPGVRASLESAAAVIPVLIAPNTSVGVNVVAHLVKLAAQALAGADVEISEAHHRMKRDAPSGTALALGEVVARARGQAFNDIAVFDRHGGLAPRRTGDIGFAVLRAGDIVGEHTVTFALAGERVEITHRATDRITFARGALRAAEWLAGRPPGLYAMEDVIGL
jgi:4-hydroxy-tetrahydrodipicolinate reductase